LDSGGGAPRRWESAETVIYERRHHALRAVTDFWRFEITPPQFDLSSQAGPFGIDARVEIDGTDVTVLIWDIN
jgi:hypothetical protein